MIRHIAFFAVVMLSMLEPLDARPIPAWSYATLVKKSDLIVIVVPTESRDAKEGDHVPPLKGFEEHSVGVVTTFEVLATVKGDVPAKSILLKHYREIPVNGGFVGNGPEFVSFEGMLKDDEWSEIDSHDSQFMIFLRKTDRGEYEFVTGQFDPRFSVKQMRQSPYRWPDKPGAE